MQMKHLLLSAALAGLWAADASAQSSHGHSHDGELAVLFEGWQGTWQSIDGLMADPGMLPLAASIASQVDGWTTSDVRNWMIDIRRDNFGVVHIDGDTITYLEDDALTVICEATYAPVEGGPIPNGSREVPITRAEMIVNEGECSPYQFIALIHVHGQPAGWHLRYGSSGFAPLEVDAWGGWWASFTPMDVTASQYAMRLQNVEHFLVEQLLEIEPRREWAMRPYHQ